MEVAGHWVQGTMFREEQLQQGVSYPWNSLCARQSQFMLLEFL